MRGDACRQRELTRRAEAAQLRNRRADLCGFCSCGMAAVESQVTEELLGLIRPHFSSIKVPGTFDKVYKDECMFSFDTPLSTGGLYVSLSTWHGFGQDFLELDHTRTGNALYLHQKWTHVPKPEDMDAQSKGEAAPTLLAIGVDGGFRTDDQKFNLVKEHALVVFSGGNMVRVRYPDEALPTLVCNVVDAIVAHQGAAEQTEVSQWVADTDVPESKYAADLPFVDSGKKISKDASTWKCEGSGMQENLWLNLSTGFVGSGRRNWDGSGGTGAALKHYEDTGKKYPLAVKLGTITPHGADVYSYAADEDGLVEDPKLGEHLARWGIDIMSLEKTDKTMAELEVELNKSYDFSKITEAGAKLRLVSGPGLVGLKNLGNSCYMNSCLQLLVTLPEVGERYLAPATDVFRTSPANPSDDFPTQMSKVATGLLSSKYAHSVSSGETMEDGAPGAADSGKGAGQAEVPKSEVAPRMFKHLVGRGHAEFSSGRQQDAAEYMQHLLEYMARSERASGDRVGGNKSRATVSLFQFRLEDRIQCLQSNAVKYITGAKENMVPLQIPLDQASNKEEVMAYQERLSKRQKLKDGPQSQVNTGSGEEDEEEVRPVVPLSACLANMFSTSVVHDYNSPVTGQVGDASKQVRMANFPRYLFVQLRRYYTDESWQPKKLDVEVDVPDTLDLEEVRSKGIQVGETPMPEEEPAATNSTVGGSGDGDAAASASAAVTPDEDLVSQLVAMGFGKNGCERAAIAVNNASAELAMNWVLEHMGDEDFNDPLPPAPAAGAGGEGGGGAAEPNQEALATLSSFGFTDAQDTGVLTAASLDHHGRIFHELDVDRLHLKARAALKATGNNAERAADWLFSHSDDLDAAVVEVESAGQDPGSGAAGSGAGDASPLEDGVGRYTLVGFVSHVGKNTGCGHYVAHIKKDGRWIIFDDQKVAESVSPPLRFGYMYLYKRDDASSELGPVASGTPS